MAQKKKSPNRHPHPPEVENPKANPDQNSNQIKDPEDWVTGHEPMTGAQASYLKTLSQEAGEPFDENLTKAEASKRIDELQRVTGRGAHANEGSLQASSHSRREDGDAREAGTASERAASREPAEGG